MFDRIATIVLAVIGAFLALCIAAEFLRPVPTYRKARVASTVHARELVTVERAPSPFAKVLRF